MPKFQVQTATLTPHHNEQVTITSLHLYAVPQLPSVYMLRQNLMHIHATSYKLTDSRHLHTPCLSIECQLDFTSAINSHVKTQR